MNDTTTTAAREPLTETTWETLDKFRTLTPEARLGWEERSDLSHALAERVPHLSIEECGLLVSVAHSGLPVVLTWEYRLNDGQIQATTATVLVEYIAAPRADEELEGSSARIRVRYSGGGHGIYLLQIVAVAPCPVTYTRRDAESE